jgi:glycosyltransferase involved in cell wall biosynthesis
MSLTVASVAYPFALVTADPVGGAEQVLARLDRALVEAGHRSIVIAPEGSKVAGELLPVPAASGAIDNNLRGRTYDAVRARIAEAVAAGADLVHLHGIDFPAYLPPPGPPVLATLHLPLGWYPPDALRPERPRTYLQPVSASQAARAPAGARLTTPIENGVDVPEISARKRDYAFMLGRICPEKGFDDALDAAVRARSPLLMAGAVYPYPEHQSFFRNRIQPRLDGCRRWLGPVAGTRKARLLASARCLLVPSKAPETSSLVAMEAIAAGTPVIAYRAGALPDIVEHGRTGYLVDGVEGMAEAIRAADRIDPAECRARARERFPLRRMTDAYLARYAELAA